MGEKFIIHYLQKGEEIKYRAKIHLFLFAEPLTLLLLGYFILYGATGLIKCLGITILFLGMVSLCQRVLVKIGALYLVTNHRVILKTGVIRRRVTELVLLKCEAIWVRQSIIGRIFGFGTLIVTTGEATSSYYFIRDPFEFKRAINIQIG